MRGNVWTGAGSPAMGGVESSSCSGTAATPPGVDQVCPPSVVTTIGDGLRKATLLYARFGSLGSAAGGPDVQTSRRGAPVSARAEDQGVVVEVDLAVGHVREARPAVDGKVQLAKPEIQPAGILGIDADRPVAQAVAATVVARRPVRHALLRGGQCLEGGAAVGRPEQAIGPRVFTG